MAAVDESALVCPSCSAVSSAFNARCARCGADLAEASAQARTVSLSSSGSGTVDGEDPRRTEVDPLATTVSASDLGDSARPDPGAPRPGAGPGRFEVLDTLG